MEDGQGQPGFVPRPPGVSRGEDSPAGQQPLAAPRFSAASSLTDHASELAYYHPGLLYCVVPLFGRDPFLSFAAETGRNELRPLRLQLTDHPIIAGFDKLSPVFRFWGFSIDCLPHDVFNELLLWLGSLSFVDRGLGDFYRLRYKEFQIRDPRFRGSVASIEDWPRVKLVTLSIDSTRGCWSFQRADKTVPGQPELSLAYSSGVFPDTLEMARLVLLDPTNPLSQLTPGAPGAGITNLEDGHE